MADIRSIRAKHRGRLHEAMKVPANYYAVGSSTPIPCTVRVHDARRLVGDVKGTSFDFAERHEDTPTVIFLIEEFDDFDVVRRGGVVSVAADLAYEIDNVKPRDGITRTANCIILSESDAATYDPPEEA